MALSDPHRQHVYIGEFADAASALVWIRAQKWDSNKDGTGNPEKGMLALIGSPAVPRVYLASGWAELSTGSGGYYDDYAVFQDQKAAGTDGGTATAGSWFTRTLNTTVKSGCGAKLSSNEVLLPKGYKYQVRAESIFNKCSFAQSRLRTVEQGWPGASKYYPGSTVVATSTYVGNQESNAYAYIDLTAETHDHKLALEGRVGVTRADDGCGDAAGWTTEVYVTVEVWRLRK